MTRTGVLVGDNLTNMAFLRVAQAVATSLGVKLVTIDLNHDGEVERAVAALAGEPDGGLLVLPNPYTAKNRDSIIVPAVYPFRFFAAAGGLMSYGIDQIDQWRRAASYVDRILRGEKPGELPVQAPTKFELVVNIKTAKAIGLNIPPAFPLRA